MIDKLNKWKETRSIELAYTICEELSVLAEILDWGKEKGINNVKNQFNKMKEETDEADEAWAGSDVFHIKEEFGDMGVVWLLACQAAGLDPFEVLSVAHNKNKHRTGVTINGNFIKDSNK